RGDRARSRLLGRAADGTRPRPRNLRGGRGVGSRPRALPGLAREDRSPRLFRRAAPRRGSCGGRALREGARGLRSGGFLARFRAEPGAQNASRRQVQMTLFLTLAIALISAYLVLLGALLVVRPKGNVLSETLRLLPDTVRLMRRLAGDRSVSRAVRAR